MKFYLLKKFLEKQLQRNYDKSHEEETTCFHGETGGKESVVVKWPGQWKQLALVSGKWVGCWNESVKGIFNRIDSKL